MNRFSIICDLDYCIECGKPYPHKHEVFYGTANRKNSIKYGIIVPLCYEHHMGTYGVHGKHGEELNYKLKKMAQQKAMKHYNWTMEEWIKIFGKKNFFIRSKKL